jgi:hypothetical protein
MADDEVTYTWTGKLTKQERFSGETGEVLLRFDDFPWFPESRTVSDTRTKVTDPNWKSKVRRHENATLPYYADRRRYKLTTGKIERVAYASFGLFDRWETVGNLVMIRDYPPPAARPTNDMFESRAYLKWVKKANKELRTLQSGVSLGELRETIHAIRHPLESLKKGLSDYLRAVPSRAEKRLGGNARRMSRGKRSKAVGQAISGTYLEYANGWAPLVGDIDAAARTLAEHFTASGVSYRKITTSERETDEVHSQYYNPSNGTDFPVILVDRKDTFENSVRITGEVAVHHTGSSSELLNSSGFTLGEFVPTAWELLPLSYVADYFFNIGDVLSSYAFLNGSRTWWSVTDRRRRLVTMKGSVNYDVELPGGYPYYSRHVYARGNPGSCEYEHTLISRSNPSYITPYIEFSLPGSHLLKRLANVSSLGVQALTSSRQLNRLIHG